MVTEKPWVFPCHICHILVLAHYHKEGEGLLGLCSMENTHTVTICPWIPHYCQLQDKRWRENRLKIKNDKGQALWNLSNCVWNQSEQLAVQRYIELFVSGLYLEVYMSGHYGYLIILNYVETGVRLSLNIIFRCMFLGID